jgi:hypothetical protein
MRTCCEFFELGCRIAELVGPVPARAPGRALEDEAYPVVPSDRSVAGEIAAQRARASLVLEQIEGGEIRQIEAVMIEQRRFDAAIGEKQAAIHLRQGVL